MQDLKAHAGWQRRNALRTGGGPPDPKPSQIKIEVTGALLELQQLYGHAMSGMDGNDCDSLATQFRDSQSQSEQTEETSSGETEIPSTIQQSDSIDIFAVDFEFLDTVPYEILHSEPIDNSCTLTETTTTVTKATTTAASAPGILPATTTSTASASQIMPAQQHFPTIAQQKQSRQRQRLAKIDNGKNEKAQTDENRADVAEPRREFILAESDRYRVEHELRIEHRRLLHEKRMAAIISENDERLTEIRSRRTYDEAIHAKQLLFWDAAIAAVARNSLPTPIEQQQETARNAITTIVNTVHVAKEGISEKYDDVDYLSEAFESDDENNREHQQVETQLLEKAKVTKTKKKLTEPAVQKMTRSRRAK